MPMEVFIEPLDEDLKCIKLTNKSSETINLGGHKLSCTAEGDQLYAISKITWLLKTWQSLHLDHICTRYEQFRIILQHSLRRKQCVLNFRLCILSSRSTNTPLVIFEQDTHDLFLMVCEFMQNGKFWHDVNFQAWRPPTPSLAQRKWTPAPPSRSGAAERQSTSPKRGSMSWRFVERNRLLDGSILP